MGKQFSKEVCGVAGVMFNALKKVQRGQCNNPHILVVQFLNAQDIKFISL